MGLPDGLTSENQTLGALWGGWEVTEVRQNCTAVSHAISNSTTVLGRPGRDSKTTLQSTATGAEVHLGQTIMHDQSFQGMYGSAMLIQIFEEI